MTATPAHRRRPAGARARPRRGAARSGSSPSLGGSPGAATTASGAGGDVTFAIDSVAEAALARFLAERAPRVAWYSEDRGLVAAPEADRRAGRRSDRRNPAGAGRVGVGLRGGRAGAAGRRGPGAWATSPRRASSRSSPGSCSSPRREPGWSSQRGRCALSPNDEPGRMFWGYGFRGRPVRADGRAAGRAHRRLLGRRRDV